MNTHGNLILFLQENLQRLFTKSPLFFKIWGVIAGTLVLITGLPDFINALTGLVTIPDLWDVKITAAIAWSSRAALFMALLTTQSQAVATTEDGTILKQTDAQALPFTAVAEQKKVDNQVVEIPILTPTP